MKTDVEQEVNEVMFTNTGSGHKQIMIYNVTGMSTDYDAYTNALVSKLNTFAKKQNLDVNVGMKSASKIDQSDDNIDIILLSPELCAMQAEIQNQFPNKAVRLIDKKDYGLMNVENVLKTALS